MPECDVLIFEADVERTFMEVPGDVLIFENESPRKTLFIDADCDVLVFESPPVVEQVEMPADILLVDETGPNVIETLDDSPDVLLLETFGGPGNPGEPGPTGPPGPGNGEVDMQDLATVFENGLI